ncbi:MAG: DUF6788 family protein, partial [Acidimicrobiales bacterium]
LASKGAQAMTTDQRRQEILAEMAGLGVVVPGSLVQRSTRCQRSGCHCHGDPPRLHGPYTTWLHQEGGHQVVRTLSSNQAERLRPLIAADRRFHELMKELELLGLSEAENLLG